MGLLCSPRKRALARTGRTTAVGFSAVLLAATLPGAPAAAAPDDGADLGTAADYGVMPTQPDTALAESTGLWFVELAGKPTARGGNAGDLEAEKARFRTEARELGAEFDERFAFGTLWNGLSVRASDADVTTLRRAGNVTAVYPVVTVDAPEPGSTSVPDMKYALGMTGADIAQNELGLDGTGVKVGVVDTGIDYDHPDFDGNGTEGSTNFPTARVTAGYDFVGDDYNADASAPSYNPVPAPDDDPDDCQGHGTHVSGIVGADGDPEANGVRGVAPGVELGAYRVFGCEGSTTSDIIVAALERALADGMDVVNQSLGAAFQTWPEYPTAVASDALVDAGVVMVASIGNSGANGTWSAGAPGVGDDVIGVASYDNEAFESAAFTISPDDRAIAYSPMTGAPPPPTRGSLPMSRTSPGGGPADGCNASLPLPDDIDGTAVLIQRGDCTFAEKALNAEAAGAAAVVVYNNVAGGFAGTVEPSEVGIPVVGISQDDGQEIDSRLDVDDVTLTWIDETIVSDNPTGGLISSFSSYGMTADLKLKPDLGAPGGLIRSTYPIESGEYAVLSGTSMSSPHVAGAVALLLERRPDIETTAVRDVLQNSADPSVWSLVPALGLLEPVHRQGAGMLDIDDTIVAEASVSPGKLSLGESEHGPVTETVTIRNDGDGDVSYDLSHVDAITTGRDTNNPSFFGGGSDVDFGTSSVTVPAGGSVDLDVTITAPGGPDLGQYGGYLVMTPDNNGAPLRVPFAGFVGDYQDIVTLTPTVNDLPELAKLTACERLIGNDCVMGASYSPERDGATFTMQDGDIPYFLVHLEHPTRSLDFKIYRANRDGSLGRPIHPRFNTAFSLDYLGRNGTANGFFAYAWDGTRQFNAGNNRVGRVPFGDYIIKMTALKALGDPSNPDHVETWLSPVISIDRNRDGRGRGRP
jgi:minor extracellular serine protease Vpr